MNQTRSAHSRMTTITSLEIIASTLVNSSSSLSASEKSALFGFVFMLAESMGQKMDAHTITWPSLTSEAAITESRELDMRIAVLNARLFAMLGEMEASSSRNWKQSLPRILRVTSQKALPRSR